MVSSSTKAAKPSADINMRLSSTATPYLTPKELAVLHGSYVIGLCSLAVSAEDIEDREIYLKEAQFELIAMEESKLKPDTATMNAFIQALCAMQPARVTDALLILRAMKIENIGPDDYTYSILFTALGKEGFIDEALQLFRSTDRLMDTPALNALLRAFIGGPDPMQAVQIYQEMVSSNSSIIENGQFTPSKYTFTILFLAISRSLAPQKFASAPERKSGDYFDDKNVLNRVRDRRTKPKPLRYLTIPRTAAGQQTATPSAPAAGDVVVDTTMRNIPPPLQALSVLGEVVKSIGNKLNAKMKVQADPVSYKIKGVYGNYVSSSYEEDLERKRRETEAAELKEKESSQPLAYDDDTGRFYEITLSKKATTTAVEGSSQITNNRAGLLSSAMKNSRQSYTTEDIMESEDPRDNMMYDKYGPPDNLDILRETYYKDQEKKVAKAKVAASTPKALTIEEEVAASRSSNVNFVNMNADALLQKLFLSMRFDYNIEADEIMISALNSLFSTTNHFQTVKNKSNDVDATANGYSNDLPTIGNDYNNYKPSTPPAVTLGWAKKTGETAAPLLLIPSLQ
jgi:pentatricopeptide repeat protein